MVDGQMGAVLEKLKEDGLLEDTFVFYFGDHGGVLPRGKGYAYESGLHVPLVVRIPENFKQLADHERGTRTDGFVSFIDFGPTVLNSPGYPFRRKSTVRPSLAKGRRPRNLPPGTRRSVTPTASTRSTTCKNLRKGAEIPPELSRFLSGWLQNNYRYRMLGLAVNGGNCTRRANSTPANGNFSNPAPRNNCSIFRRTPTR